MVPPTTAVTELGELKVSLRPGSGGTFLDIPPLGRVVADTHRSPVDLHVTLSRIDLGNSEEVATSVSARTALLDATERELRSALIRHALLGALSGAALSALFAHVRRRSPRSVLATIAVSLTCSVTVGLGAFLDFDSQAFSSPRFQGPLASAPSVLKKLDSALENVSLFRGRLGDITAQVELLTAPLPPEEASTTILHVSDIHSNVVGFAWVDELVRRFRPDVVVDTGDVTSFGVAVEEQALDRFLETPRESYLVTFGNHDSQELRERLSRRITPIHERVVTVGEVTIIGLDDPTYTARVGSTPADEEKYARSGTRLAELCARHRPVVVAVHNPSQARFVDGCAQVVLSGHLHVPDQYRLPKGTVVSVSGTSGASGLEGLNRDGVYFAELLRFDAGVLRSVDVVEMNPVTGEIAVRRVVAEHLPTRP